MWPPIEYALPVITHEQGTSFRTPLSRKKRKHSGSAPMQITPSGFKKPSGVTQWSTLLRNNRELSKLYGRDVINTSRAGYDIYRASSSVQCVLDSACSSKLFAAKTHSIKQHINRCHSDIGRVRAQPTIEQSMQKHSATRSTLTAAEARHILATKASMELFALGISAHTIEL